jgi:hypothetical protein
MGLSCPFGGDRREWDAKKTLLLGDFQHHSSLSEVVRLLGGGASDDADEVASRAPRLKRQLRFALRPGKPKVAGTSAA